MVEKNDWNSARGLKIFLTRVYPSFYGLKLDTPILLCNSN